MTDNTVYSFNDTEIPTGNLSLKELLGGKGANLNVMTTQLGLPVPQGFTIPTIHSASYADADMLSDDLMASVTDAVAVIEAESGRNFGGTNKPLLLSVRSGAAISMPGMMETVLNLGMNAEVAEALAAETNEDFAYDSYRRFIQMYATIVLGDDHSWFQQRTMTAVKFFNSRPIPADASRLLIKAFLERVEIPTNPYGQLQQAILAVFRSWNSDKAVAYRDIEGIDHNIGTAVTVQRMVFGNLNDASGTGVAFTRNPNTGEAVPYGDFLVNAQGEDVVDGSTVTQPLADMSKVFASQATELDSIMARLEDHYNDMCDIEFTIEDGNLFMLQTRIGKRSSLAEIRIVADLLSEGRIDSDEGVERLAKAHANGAAQVDVEFEGTAVATGLGASGALVVGKAYFSKETAIAAAEDGEDVILIRHETSPEDTAAMAKSIGILTMTGGLVSHAAVVARSWDKTAVVGLGEQHYLLGDSMKFHGLDLVLKQGETIGINGMTGEVLLPSHVVPVPKPPLAAGTHKNTSLLSEGDTVTIPGIKENVKFKYQSLSSHSQTQLDKYLNKPLSYWNTYEGSGGYHLFINDSEFEIVKIVSPRIAIMRSANDSISKSAFFRFNLQQTPVTTKG